MYQTAYGVLPYEGNDVYEIENKINNLPLPFPKNKEGQYSQFFVDLIVKMLEKNPKERLSMVDVIQHQFCSRFQSLRSDEKNNLDSNLIFLKNNLVIEKTFLGIKPLQPPEYDNIQVEKIDVIKCPENYSFPRNSNSIIYSSFRFKSDSF